MTRKIEIDLSVAAILSALVGGVWYWTVGRFQETTNDTYVSGNVVTVMNQVSGRVDRVLVQDHQYVRAGDMLIVIDTTDTVLARLFR